MKRALLVALVVAASGCAFRPWTCEESSRIDSIVQHRSDPADEAAASGIPSPSGLSPAGGGVAYASVEPSLGKRKKKGGKGTPAKDPFTWAGPEVPVPGKSSKSKPAKY